MNEINIITGEVVFPDGVGEAFRRIATHYVRDLLTQDNGVILSELGGNRFTVYALSDSEEYDRFLSPSNLRNIVNRAINMVVDPSETMICVFTEPQDCGSIDAFVLETERCGKEFLRFVKYILDDVEDEEDGYVPLYEVSQY